MTKEFLRIKLKFVDERVKGKRIKFTSRLKVTVMGSLFIHNVW